MQVPGLNQRTENAQPCARLIAWTTQTGACPCIWEHQKPKKHVNSEQQNQPKTMETQSNQT